MIYILLTLGGVANVGGVVKVGGVAKVGGSTYRQTAGDKIIIKTAPSTTTLPASLATSVTYPVTFTTGINRNTENDFSSIFNYQ